MKINGVSNKIWLFILLLPPAKQTPEFCTEPALFCWPSRWLLYLNNGLLIVIGNHLSSDLLVISLRTLLTSPIVLNHNTLFYSTTCIRKLKQIIRCVIIFNGNLSLGWNTWTHMAYGWLHLKRRTITVCDTCLLYNTFV